MVRLSLGVPANELLPIPKLNKALVAAMRKLEGSGTAYDILQGNENLRRQIAKKSLNGGGHLSENDIVTTPGCLNAIAYALMTIL